MSVKTDVVSESRVGVWKTYKIYIDGKFPRTESGRYYELRGAEWKLLANVSLSSRKDVRDAVTAARKAFPSWAKTGATLRGQILYRMAEMLEGRRAQFIEELISMGSSEAEAAKEVSASVDRLVYYAGWSDKYGQVFSSVNPVASAHFNFSVPEPTGVVGVFLGDRRGLLDVVTALAPVVVGGNALVMVSSETKPLCAVTFAEVLETSDLPGGVVNIVTGRRDELLMSLSSHMDVNAILGLELGESEGRQVEEASSLNVKRFKGYSVSGDEDTASEENPYRILDFQEIKTTWHPVGQ